MGESFLDF